MEPDEMPPPTDSPEQSLGPDDAIESATEDALSDDETATSRDDMEDQSRNPS